MLKEYYSFLQFQKKYGIITTFILMFFCLFSFSQKTSFSTKPISNNVGLLNDLTIHNFQLFIEEHLKSKKILLENSNYSLARLSAEENENRAIDLLAFQLDQTVNKKEIEKLSILQANQYFVSGDYDNAYTYFKASENSALLNSIDLQFQYGYSAFALQKFEEAQKIMHPISKSSTKYKQHGTYYAGMCAYFQNNTESTLNYFLSLENDPYYGNTIRQYLAQLFFINKKYKEAITYCKKELDQNTSNANLLSITAQSYYYLSDFRFATEYFEKYSNYKKPIFQQEAYQFGHAYQEIGQHEKAKAQLTKVAEIENELGLLALFKLSEIHFYNNDLNQTINTLRLIIKKSTNENLINEARFIAGSLACNETDFRSALQFYSSIPQKNEFAKKVKPIINEILKTSNDIHASISFIENENPIQDVYMDTYHYLLTKSAIQSFNNNKYSEAEKTLSKIGSENKQSDYAALLKGKIAFNKNNFDQAKVFFEGLSNEENLNNNHDLICHSNYYLGIIYQKEDQFEISNQFFQKSIDKSSGTYESKIHIESQKQYSSNLLLQKDYRNAKTPLLALLKIPNIPHDYPNFYLSKIYGIDGNSYDQIIHLESIITNPNKSDFTQKAYFELGNTYLKLAQNNKALNNFNKATDLNTMDHFTTMEAWLQKGLLYFNIGKTKEAIISYKKVVESKANSSQKTVAIEALKEIYFEELGESNDFFDYVKTNTSIDYSTLAQDSLSFNLAQRKFKEGDYRTAIISLERYIEDFPSGLYVTNAQYFIAESYVLLQSYEEACIYYLKTSKGNDEDLASKSLRKAGLISLNQTMNLDQAINCFESLLTKNISPIIRLEALDAITFISFKQNKFDNCIEFGSKLLKTANKTPKQTLYTTYYLAKSHQALGQDEKAVKLFNSIQQIGNLNSNILAESSYQTASIFYSSGQIGSAERQALETTKRASQYPIWIAKSLLLLSDIYIDKEDFINAQASAEAVIDNYTENKTLIDEANDKLMLISSIKNKRENLKIVSDSIEFQTIEN